MGKIKNFLSLWFSSEILVIFIALIVLTAILIGLQSLLIWIGGLFTSIENLGITIDAILGFVLLFPLFLGAVFTNHEGNGNILVGLLAIMGIYISVVWYFHAGILVGCIVLLCQSLRRLDKIGADPIWIHCGMSAHLLYCIGAYFAMIFNGLEPASSVYGIVILSIVTLCIWFVPMFKALK